MAKEHYKMLVVDDEPDITSSFQSFFGRRGFLVNTTASGKDALDMIKTSKPDLIFLDLTLSELNGREVLKRLREHDKKTRVIIITGHTLNSENEEKEFSALGISAYLNKPIKLDDLAAVVERVLGKKLSVKNFKAHKKFKTINRSDSATAHRLRNLLGNLRNECEVFLLNKKDGIYNDRPQEEMNGMTEEIIQSTIKTIDQAIEVFEGTRDGK